MSQEAAPAIPVAGPAPVHRAGGLAVARAALRQHRLLLGLLALVIATGYAAQAVLRLPNVMGNLWFPPSYYYFIQVLPLPLPFAFLWLRLTARDADGQWLTGRAGWALAWRRFRQHYLTPTRVAGALIAGLTVAVGINVFGAWKLSIPRIHPFDWDARLAAFDRALHGGHYPWELLQPLLGHPAITNALDITYFTWLPLLAVVCAWQAWSPRRDLRLRFFLSFVLVWILLGDVAATLLSSAGPCFYGRLVAGPNPFAALFAYHAQVGEIHRLGSPLVQDALWQHYIGATATPYTGISAMPSIHVSMPVLYSLLTWKISRKLAVPFIVYAVVIWLGSIHLGWHYAVDGYASLIGVAAIWWLTGVVVRRFAPDEGRTTSTRTETAAA